MAIHLKNPDVIRLATRLSALTGESRAETIRTALEEKMARLHGTSVQASRRAELVRVLGCKVPAMIRAGRRKTSLTEAEIQELLAYGP